MKSFTSKRTGLEKSSTGQYQQQTKLGHNPYCQHSKFYLCPGIIFIAFDLSRQMNILPKAADCEGYFKISLEQGE